MSKPRVYKFEGKKGVTVDGHTMLIDDVVRDLNKLVAFERERDELILKIKELESKIEKAINYVDEYLVNGDEGLMNEMKDAMMMEDES